MREHHSDLEWGCGLKVGLEAGCSSTGGEWRVSLGARIVILSSWQVNSYTSHYLSGSAQTSPSWKFLSWIWLYWKWLEVWGRGTTEFLTVTGACQDMLAPPHFTSHWAPALISTGYRVGMRKGRPGRGHFKQTEWRQNKLPNVRLLCFVCLHTVKILFILEINYYIKPKL